MCMYVYIYIIIHITTHDSYLRYSKLLPEHEDFLSSQSAFGTFVHRTAQSGTTPSELQTSLVECRPLKIIKATMWGTQRIAKLVYNIL